MAAQDVALKPGRYYDAAIDGRLFHASTAATGVAPGTAIGTTAAFSLHNPLGSAVDLAILVASMAYISGPLGRGGGGGGRGRRHHLAARLHVLAARDHGRRRLTPRGLRRHLGGDRDRRRLEPAPGGVHHGLQDRRAPQAAGWRDVRVAGTHLRQRRWQALR